MTDAILLDLDGTLIDSTYYHAVAWQRALASEGFEVPMWRCHRAIGLGGDKVVEHLVDAKAEQEHGDALRAAWKVLYEQLVSYVKPLPGAADFVRAARERGFEVALATSGEQEFTDIALEMLGIADELAAVVSTADVEASKPAPDLVEEALKRVSPDRAVMVGDTTWDIAAAKKAGIGCIGVRTGGFGDDDLQDEGALAIVDDPRDLEALLLGGGDEYFSAVS